MQAGWVQSQRPACLCWRVLFLNGTAFSGNLIGWDTSRCRMHGSVMSARGVPCLGHVSRTAHRQPTCVDAWPPQVLRSSWERRGTDAVESVDDVGEEETRSCGSRCSTNLSASQFCSLGVLYGVQALPSM